MLALEKRTQTLQRLFETEAARARSIAIILKDKALFSRSRELLEKLQAPSGAIGRGKVARGNPRSVS